MNKKSPSPTQANPELLVLVADLLSAASAPALSAYDLGKIAYLKGKLDTVSAPKKEFELIVKALAGFRLIKPLDSRAAFILFGHHSATPAEIACCLDPFAYVSHLSAMEHHGLTDRFPKLLYLTRPIASEWRKQADFRMQKDLGNVLEHYKKSGMPRLTRPSLNTIKDTTVHTQERSHLGAFRNVSGSALRVATIGSVVAY